MLPYGQAIDIIDVPPDTKKHIGILFTYPVWGLRIHREKMWVFWSSPEKWGTFPHDIKGGSNEGNCIKNVHGRQKLQ